MKKVILVMVVALVSVATVSAQFTKGGKTLSANVTGLDFGITSVKDVDDSPINFGLGITGSYFVIDNLAITAGLGFDYYKEGDYNTNRFNFEIGGRYYVYQGLFAALAYEGAKEKDFDLAGYGRIQLGYDLYITDNVFFEPALYFKKGFGDLTKDITQFGLSIGIGVNF
jgi:hypothetical protein